MSVEYYNTLLKTYVPVFYIHSFEKYFPSSIDWILRYSTLVDHNTGTIIHKPNSRDMYEISKRYNFTVHNQGDIVLSLSPQAFTGQHPDQEIPIYGYYKIINNNIMSASGGKNNIYITYIIIHAYNGDYKLGKFYIGGHPFDIEHVTIELDHSYKISRAYFSFHNSGKWIDRKDLIIEGNKLVCFIALNGHGLYPYEGVYLRYFGFGNDYTDRGILWSPAIEIIDFYHPNRDHHGWFLFNGRLGGTLQPGDTTGITSLLDKKWIQNIDSTEDSMIYITGENYNVFTIYKNISLYIITGVIIYFKFIKHIKGKNRRRLLFIFVYTLLTMIYGYYLSL